MDEECKVIGSLLGHKGRCFDARFHPDDSKRLVTASEDGNAKVWDITRKSCLQTLNHNKNAEVLRASFTNSAVVTAGSDGVVKIWASSVSETGSQSQHYSQLSILDHGGEDSQVYVCEPDSDGGILMTGVENHLLLWDMQTQKRLQDFSYFDQRDEAFGGSSRNPDKQSYVFDAKWRPSCSNTAVVALSDSTLRFVDTRARQEDHQSIELDDESINLGHATATHWSKCGNQCFVGFGSGNIAIADVRKGECLGIVKLHASPCYGMASKDGSYFSWSSDSSIRVWEPTVDELGELDECIIHSSQRLKDFSLLSCCSIPESKSVVCCGSFITENKHGMAFLGTPVYIVDL